MLHRVSDSLRDPSREDPKGIERRTKVVSPQPRRKRFNAALSPNGSRPS